MPRIQIKSLTKRFDKICAVDDFSLTINEGEFMVLVGPSGCGKTTILRIVAGLEDPDMGVVEIGGVDVTNVRSKDRNIAMVFQNYALYPHMTVFKNTAFGLRRRKIPKEEIIRRVHHAAKIMGIADLLNRKPYQLSGGQRQRVAVCRAIVRDPSVFLFDEPLSNLDAKLRVAARWEIKKLLNDLHTTSIYVTHDQTEAMTMGDRIALVNEGRLQQVSTPIEMYDKPANRYVASFIGSPAMNLFSGRVSQKDGKMYLETLGASFLLRPADVGATKVDVGLRPEYIYGTPSNTLKLERIRGEVELTETLGMEVILNVQINGERIVAKLDRRSNARPGDEVDLFFDMNQVHIFDKETGDRIEY